MWARGRNKNTLKHIVIKNTCEQTDLQIQHNFSKISAAYFEEIDKFILKSVWELKGLRTAKHFLSFFFLKN